MSFVPGFKRPNFGLWTPRALFLSGAAGAWYDPSDVGTLFQDAAGTTPVTSDGDPVGLMLDKSGHGNDVSQSTTASKPTYRTDGVLHWLEFDGVDDYLVAIYPTAQPFTQVVAVGDVTTNGTGNTLIGGGTGNDSLIYDYASSPAGELALFAGSQLLLGPHPASKFLISGLYNTTGSEGAYNGSPIIAGSVGPADGTGTVIGSRYNGGNPAQFNFFGFVKFSSPTDTKRTQAERYLAKLAAVAL